MSKKMRAVLLWTAMSALVPVMISGCDTGPSTKEKDKRVIDVFMLAAAGALLVQSRRRTSGRGGLKAVVV